MGPLLAKRDTQAFGLQMSLPDLQAIFGTRFLEQFLRIFQLQPLVSEAAFFRFPFCLVRGLKIHDVFVVVFWIVILEFKKRAYPINIPPFTLSTCPVI